VPESAGSRAAAIPDRLPGSTLDWLTSEDNPAVAVLTRRTLLSEPDSPAIGALWARRNEYEPVAAILGAELEDGSWAAPSQDYRKYEGSLWQIHFLGELHADGRDERVRRAAEYAFSRQMPDGSWSASNARASGSIPCLTANVGRALARLGWERDDRVVGALDYCVRLHRELGSVDCRQMLGYQLNGYCHMLTPKTLLFLAQVPRDHWPDGADGLRDECVAKLRNRSVFRYLPTEAREYQEGWRWSRSPERKGLRERFLTEHPELHYRDKAGWLAFGFPLSYNSDALEALAALAAIGESPRPEYADAVALVTDAADGTMRWKMRNSFNGKMIADVEKKGAPSKWLTLRALEVLAWAESAVVSDAP
jgi:hypothetical protein